MKRRRVAILGAVVCVALSSFGEKPWYTEPGNPATLHSSGFLLHTRLPRGWTVADGAMVPPAACGAGCRVDIRFYRDHEWNRFLVAVLGTDGRGPGRRQAVLRVGGHPAVRDAYASGDDEVTNFYVNLSSLEPDSVAVLTLTQRLPVDQRDCELQFLAVVQSAEFAERDAVPAA